MVSLLSKMEMSLKDNGSRIREMVLVFYYVILATSMKVNGSLTRSREKV